jgi:hypothetical protein
MHRIRFAAVALATAASVLAAAPASHAASGGLDGQPVTLGTGLALNADSYDALTTKQGTTYVAWISSTSGDLREVHLCVLPQGASGCQGGVQTASALDGSSAQDMHVVNVAGTVELVWIAQPNPDSGEFSGTFGVAQVNSSGVLGSSASYGGAPTYGDLTGVTVHGNSVEMAAVGNSGYDQNVYYYSGITATPKKLTRPYYIGNAQIADDGDSVVITTSHYGSLGEKVSVASENEKSGKWSGFSNVAGSYTAGALERLLLTHGKITMVGMSDKALYTPYTYIWKGSSFDGPNATGGKNDISTVDLNTDASGRMVSVFTESGQLQIGNFGEGSHMATFGLNTSKLTLAGGEPQISTSRDGLGWLFYSYEQPGGIGDKLVAQPIDIPALANTVTGHGKHGSVKLTGPANCFPESKLGISAKGNGDKGWKVDRTDLTLDGKNVSSPLDGSKLKASTQYSLEGSVTFKNGKDTSDASVKMSFTTCARP